MIDDTFGEIISEYTRAQAIEDGVLVDVSGMAKEAGFKWPVTVTRRVWDEVVEPDKFALAHGESVSGRLWDVLTMARWAAMSARAGRVEWPFSLLATQHGHRRRVELKIHCGPGDTPAPCLTIMLPEED